MRVRNVYPIQSQLLIRYIILTNKTFCLILFFFLTFFLPQPMYSQDQPDYDEVPVFLDVPRLGGTDMTAVIRGQDLYLPVTDLFEFLKIRNVPTSALESVSGFFISPDAPFLISRTDNIITYQGKTTNLKQGDLIRTESNLYLRSVYFGEVFGLDCKFNFRNLSVTVNSKLELPLIKEMRQEEMRRNLTRLKGDIKADTTINRSYPVFRFGMADWSATATEEINGKSNASVNLSLGSMIAGGEATALLNYNSAYKFEEKQQYYLWRYVDNDFKPLRQVMAGKIATHATSTIFNPVIGIQLTNTPSTYRRSFGTYTLSDKTEPGWVVELYVNNVLVDYVKADASGFFTFEVPLVYGNSIVKLRFFGPWGEERTREQNINIPFNFLPTNTMEYSVSAGIVEDTLMSRFARASINYGVSRKITVGGGVEYLSSVRSGPSMPYFNASFSILKNLLLSGEYTFGVRAKGTLKYRLPSNLQIDLNYTKYEKDQTAINYNYLEERKATLTLPVRIKNYSTFQRLTLYQIVMPYSTFTTGEWMFSGSVFGVNTNLTTYALFMENINPNIYSNLSMSIKLPANIVFMPQVQYGFTQNSFLSIRLALEKPIIKNGYLNLSAEQNFVNNLQMAEVGFRYDFSFAQTGASVRQNDRRTTLVQYARGSLIYDKSTKYLGADNRTNVGRGGISVIPYLDLNANGIRDAGEPKAYGLNLRANSGRIEKSERDTTIRILGLEPYTSCFIELDPGSFENVSWRLPVQTLSVSVDPDILKHIEIPVTVAGEASGKVMLEKDGETRGLGRIIVRFYSENKKLAGKVLTEDDGYFSYFGLTPGSYSVRVDTTQLKKLGMTAEPGSLAFSIKPGSDGDIVDGLDFKLKVLIADTAAGKLPVEETKPVVRRDTSVMVIHEVSQELVTIAEDSYSIQLGAFRQKTNADALRNLLEKQLGRKVSIIIENDLYKVRIDEIKTRKEADEIIETLRKNGITELWLISLKAKKQQWIVTERQDTVTKITETTLQNPPLPVNSDMLIGAFRLWSNSIALRALATTSLDKKLIVTNVGGFYKVTIAGAPKLDETVLVEMKKHEPSIGKVKFKDFFILPIQPLLEDKPEVIVHEEPPGTVEQKIEIPSFDNPETKRGIIENKASRPVAGREPTISIQVAIFYKKSEALRAQRKIISKLKLPVEIVKQWEAYRVIITGFETREETYKYYPELAGLGYPGIKIIENK